MCVWDETGGAPVPRARLELPDAVACIASGVEGDRFVCGLEGGGIVAVDGTRILWQVAGHGGAVECLGAGDGVVLSSGNRRLMAWAADDGELLYQVPSIDDEVTGIRICCGIAVTSAYSPTLRLWDVATGASAGLLRGHEDVVFAFELSLTHRTVVSGGGDGHVRLWTLDHLVCAHTLCGHRGEVYCVGCTDSFVVRPPPPHRCCHWHSRARGTGERGLGLVCSAVVLVRGATRVARCGACRHRSAAAR